MWGYVPEGRQICQMCELTRPKELIQIMSKGRELLNITIPLPPITKKNSQQIVINRKTQKPVIIQSKKYLHYEQDCGYFIKRPNEPIDRPINIKAIYYMPTRRRVDLINLHAALHDVLVAYRVIADDNCKIVVGTDGSRVMYDKNNPRTEICITEVPGNG